MTHTPQPCLIVATLLRPCSEEDRPGEVLVQLPSGERIFMRRADAHTTRSAALQALPLHVKATDQDAVA